MSRDLARRLAALQREVRHLSRPQLAFSSIEDGAIEVYQDEQLSMVVGEQYDGTVAPAVVSGPVPPTPFMPGVSSAPGGIVVVWSGLFEGDAVAPMDFSKVAIHASTDATFAASTLTMRGAFTSPQGGEMFIALSDPVEHYVGLVAASLAGKMSPISVKVAGTPGPADAGQIVKTHTVVAVGAQTIELDSTPSGGGALYWGGLWQPPTEWSRVGTTVTVPDAGGHLQVGHELAFVYEAR